MFLKAFCFHITLIFHLLHSTDASALKKHSHPCKTPFTYFGVIQIVKSPGAIILNMSALGHRLNNQIRGLELNVVEK